MMDTEKLQKATVHGKDDHDRLVLAIAVFIENRKLSPTETFVPGTVDGFNLACDFLADELRTLVKSRLLNENLRKKLEES